MVTILCSGSRGDVQPYIALAQGLVRAGLEARIAANKEFEGFVRSYGIDYYPIDVDHIMAGVDPEMIREARQADNLFKMFRSFRKMRDYAVLMVELYHEACLGSDAIIWHPGIAIGHFMAQRLGIPSIMASPFPLHRSLERPSLLSYGRIASSRILNQLSHNALQSMLWMASESTLRSFWKKRYGILPSGFSNPLEKVDAGHPALISCSDLIFPSPADWSPHVHQRGYWIVEEPKAYIPAPELASFLASGEAPVYIGFGSMMDKGGANDLCHMAIKALALSGKRGILSGFGKQNNLPPGILAIEGVPHTWLFPRMAAVVHHGGAGTSAAGFCAGVPGIITPFALDQHAWAARAHELGVAVQPLPVKRLSSESLSEAIINASAPDMISRAGAMGRALSAERGADDCAAVVAGTLAEKNHE